MDKAPSLIRTPADVVFNCAQNAARMLESGECNNTELQDTLELLIASPFGYCHKELITQIEDYLKTQQAEA